MPINYSWNVCRMSFVQNYWIFIAYLCKIAKRWFFIVCRCESEANFWKLHVFFISSPFDQKSLMDFFRGMKVFGKEKWWWNFIDQLSKWWIFFSLAFLFDFYLLLGISLLKLTIYEFIFQLGFNQIIQTKTFCQRDQSYKKLKWPNLKAQTNTFASKLAKFKH